MASLTTDCRIHGRTACDPALGHCLQCAAILVKPPCQDEFEGQTKAPAATIPSANEMQVGGSHYRTGYQHWDFVVDMGLDYYQACATKYVTRWRKKNGLEDLNKAPHYIMKRAELVKAGRIKTGLHRHATHSQVIEAVFRLGQENGLDAFDTETIYLIAMERDEEAREKLEQLIAHRSPKK